MEARSECDRLVALSNITEQTINATMKITDGQESDIGDHTISISPHGTKVVTLSELPLASSTVGGVYLTYAGLRTDWWSTLL